jgi:hypothetical protein
VNTIDGPAPVRFATSGVDITWTWLGNGSPGGGPRHAHLSCGTNALGASWRRHVGSDAPPGPTPHGKHSLVDGSQ